MDQAFLLAPATAGLAAVLILASKLFAGGDPLEAIPTVGFSGPLSYYYSAYKFTFDARAIVKEGCDRYKGGIYKIATPERWRVVVFGAKMIEEVHKGRDDELSFMEAALDLTQVHWTMGASIIRNPYHVPIIRSQLIRNLSALFPEVHDEIISAWDDALPIKGHDEWVKAPGLSLVQKIVSRASNRLFVGLPLCRDPDFVDLNIQFARDVMKSAAILNLTPSFLQFIVGRLLTSVPTSIERSFRHMKPIIEERQKLMDEYGKDYPDKPNDFLTWLLDEAEGEERDPREVTRRMLALNFAAINTSSTSFTHALFNLAAMPEYAQPLRQEIEAVVREHGLTKLALSHMRKVDSFIKESMRTNVHGSLTMIRKVLKDFTFSNGIRLPAGTHVSVSSEATHYKEESYKDPHVFDGFRFSRMRDSEGEGVKHQLVSTGIDYLSFGHGKHACPGRFFASNEMKLMFVHLMMSYDVKLEDGVRPPNVWFADSCVPNPSAYVLFRKRDS